MAVLADSTSSLRTPSPRKPAAPHPTIEARLREAFGPIARFVARRYFEPIPLPPEGLRTLETLSTQGDVVHVMRTTGILNFFFLAWTLLRKGLPGLKTVFGLDTFGWAHLKPFLRDGSFASRIDGSFAEGKSILLFLRGPRARVPDLTPPPDPLDALIARARVSPRPIYLVPELFLWQSKVRNVIPSFTDLLLGDPEAPGILRTAAGFWINRDSAAFHVSEPLDLTTWVAAQPEPASDQRLAQTLRGLLRQQLGREARPVVGPPRLPASRTIEHTLRTPSLNATFAEIAEAQNRPLQEVKNEARKLLGKLAARQTPIVIAGCKLPLTWLFTRLHAGVIVDEKGLSRALATAKTTPIIYCPTHKSHLDYLLMDWVLWLRGIAPPLVAAGANLSFWPLGPFFASCGAFFLRRSFKGDKVYSATFRAYIRQLLREGYAQEFFIEGGRSRTGKLLQPKLGMLSFEVDAFLDGAQEDVYFVPAAIDYESLIEGKSYARELAGGEKKPESIKSLLTAPKILAHRYGRIYLSFSEPISLRAFFRERAPSLEGLSESARRAAIQELAHAIIHGCSRAITITPGALLAAALLADYGHPTAIATATARIDYLRAMAQRDAIRLSPFLNHAPSDPTRPGPLNEILRRLMIDGTIEAIAQGATTAYAVRPEKRGAIVYYKNNLLNLVAGRALVALALRGLGGSADRSALQERFIQLRELLRRELALPPTAHLDVELTRLVTALEEEGGLTQRDGRIREAMTSLGRERMKLLRNLFRDLLDAYAIVADYRELATAGLTRKELSKALSERGRAQVAAGRRCPEAINTPTFENALAAFAASQEPSASASASTSAPSAPSAGYASSDLDRCLR